MRLRHRGGDLAVALPRHLEGVRAGTDKRVGLEDVARLAPPRQPVVRAQAREPAGIVPDLLAAELVCDPAGVGDEADDRHERDREREAAQQPRHVAAPCRRQRTSRELAGAGRDERAADDQQQAEPGPVGDAVGVRRAVLDERRPRERPAGDYGRRHDRDEREQSGLDAVAAEPEPEHGAEHGGRDAGTRGGQEDRDDGRVRKHRAAHPRRDGSRRRGEREREHQQCIGGERERVPVADRVAQPGGAAAVGEDGRDRLARERPDDAGAERNGQRGGSELRGLPRAGAEQEADGEERDVHERPVQLDPREIGCDRPGDREPAPRRGRDQQPDEHPAAAGQRRPTGQRERPPTARHEQSSERCPDGIAREHGAEQQRGRDRHRHTGPPHRGQASMVTGKAGTPYPRGLTKRLPAPHPDINAVRETLHHSPQSAG